jgi:hypothetical protein
MAPPRMLRDKHVKLKVAGALESDGESELRPEVLLATPRCHPDANQFRRRETREVGQRTDKPNWRRNVTFEALGWHMADRLQQEKILAGDTLDIAFSVGHNDHPQYGGLELTLCDFRVKSQAQEETSRNEKADSAPAV